MRRYFLLFAILVLFTATSTRADEVVTASGFTWDKPDISIFPTEQVRWNWAGTHTSTSTTANNCTAGGTDPWNFTVSGMSHTFNTVNDYNYMCGIHCLMGMKGIVRVIDFNISCTPNTVDAVQGGNDTTVCTITSTNGFSLPVTLNTTGLPAGATALFSANPVTPPANSSIDSTATINVGGAVAPGSYPFSITATATSQSSTPKIVTKTFSMTLNVTAAMDFTIDCNPSTWTMTADGSDTNTCTVHSIGGFSNTVDMGCSGNPAGSTCTFSVDPVTPPANGDATTDVTIDAQGMAAAGNYNIQISGTGTPGTRTFDGTLVIQDYSVSATATTLIAPPGGSASTSGTVISQFGFNNAVNLSCTGLPAGATCVFTPPQVTPPPNGAVNYDVTVNVGGAVPENTYPFQITGTSGGLVHNQSMSLIVTTAQDFSINCAPTIVSGHRTEAPTTTCTIGSINAFTGDVTLSCGGLPSGASCSFDVNPVTPPNGGTADSIATVTIDNTVLIGSYPITIDATDGASLNHSANLTLNVTPLYSDAFDDNDASDWTFDKGTWSGTTGSLVGTFPKKATAAAPYVMNAAQTVEADLRSAPGTGQVSLYGWFIDKKTLVEVIMKQSKGRWLLKQVANGTKGAKAKAAATINANTTYHVILSFDGTNFHVSIDGVELITAPGLTPPNGSPGFKVKGTTGTFDNIIVY